MNQTPQSVRQHIAIFGETNSGKSSLFNALLGQDISIVSELSGTTTDPVTKAMELLPYGPVVLLDTAGINDHSQLGEVRAAKTIEVLDRTHLAIYTVDMDHCHLEEYHRLQAVFQKKNVPHIVVLTKKNSYTTEQLQAYAKNFTVKVFCCDVLDQASISDLKQSLASILSENESKPDSLIGDLVTQGQTVLMVVPLDSSAPVGRLILPQVQLIRDCLDHGVQCLVTTDTGLNEAISKHGHTIDMVLTDSQVFKKVAEIIPADMPLTSFSILMAKQKGDLPSLIEGINAIQKLQNNSRILIAETCTHNHNHEDIGRVKIPTLLQKATGLSLEFHFSAGRDYPKDLDQYDLVIHCGGCMITRKEMCHRIDTALSHRVPITNYGLVLSYVSGTLERSIACVMQQKTERS